MEEAPTTVSLSLTHISYDPNDPLSYFSAWLSLVPQGLIVVYATLGWASREAEILLALGGQLACEAVNAALKRIIREERPRNMHREKGYGMPSSHAQFMAFFAVYVGLFLLLRHRPAGRKGAAGPTSSSSSLLSGLLSVLPGPYAQQVLMSFALVVNASLVAASRVYLGYHTSKQVFVGCGVGAVFAMAWFAVTALIREWGFLQWVLDLELVRLLRIRDLLLDEDLMESGWREYEVRRNERERQSKKKSK